jgi:hypothetical protein
MGGVFISYRREGSSAAAKAISDQLKKLRVCDLNHSSERKTALTVF